MSHYFIGTMSGTSADAVDVCLVDFAGGIGFYASHSEALSSAYKQTYEEIVLAGYKSWHDPNKLEELNQELTTVTIQAIEQLLQKEGLKPTDIRSVGFSGHTIYHDAEQSIQLGCPQTLANALQINVISDFRNFDMRSGGLGAPLVPPFHHYLYEEYSDSGLVINIGGIANATFLNQGCIELATDIGPGNCLIDWVASNFFNCPFDANGSLAAQGSVNVPLLENLQKSLEKLTYPRADDKSLYYKLLDQHMTTINNYDLLRTVTELTAIAIENFVHECHKPDTIIVHGGGTNNEFLMLLIEEKLGQELWVDHKVPSQYVESAAFAFLAFLVRGKKFTFEKGNQLTVK